MTQGQLQRMSDTVPQESRGLDGLNDAAQMDDGIHRHNRMSGTLVNEMLGLSKGHQGAA